MIAERHTHIKRSIVVLCLTVLMLAAMGVRAYATESDQTEAATQAGAEETSESSEENASESSQSSDESKTETDSESENSNSQASSSSSTGDTQTSASDSTASAEAEAATNEATKTSKQESTKNVVREKINVTVAFIGPDGEWERMDVSVDEGSDAWDATLEALGSCSLVYETGSDVAYDVVNSLARGYDEEPCVTDTVLGSAWHLYVNGERYEGSASTLEVQEGDVLEWRFEIGVVTVSVSVVGPGGTGLDYWIAPTSVDVLATSSVWDASKVVFEQNGYVDGRLLSYTTSEDGSVIMDSLASLGANGITGEAWQLFVNGMRPEQNAAFERVNEGDSICWYYAGNGENALPSFVAKTGAASPSPAAALTLEGTVGQSWAWNASDGVSLASKLNSSLGLASSGQSENGYIAYDKVSPLSSAYESSMSPRPWKNSLAYLLDGKLATGEGGRAALASDGSLLYRDDSGTVIKLELM